MKTGSRKVRPPRPDAEEIHRWLQRVDLSRLPSRTKFRKVTFPRLQFTDWNKFYREFQKSKPISIRLPIRVIEKLKQVALQKGLAYQSLIRMWVTDKLHMLP